MTWVKYRNKRGTLNTSLTVERMSAMQLATYINAHKKEGTKRVEIWDLAPHLDRPTVDAAQAMQMEGWT